MATHSSYPRTAALADPTSDLVQILDRYLADLQAGRRPDRGRLLADHPELAEQLEACLAGLDFLQGASQGAATVPDRLGDYQIVREVGRGGMGVVYEAQQISLKRRVALKVLRHAASGDDAMQRFHREAETVAGLHHTNIVPIFAIGHEAGLPYYAMQFIEGRSLGDLIATVRQKSSVTGQATEVGRHRPADNGQGTGGGHPTRGPENPPKPETGDPSRIDRLISALSTDFSSNPKRYFRRVAEFGIQAAQGLNHAHQRGVVHRDIKPSNLILDPDGRIWLTDFGLAKRIDDVTLSVTGALLGTPLYMSPEQASAMSRSVDYRTDIYSLGATLYELATGRPIFHAHSPQAVISQILHAEPPQPRRVAPHVPRDLETVILKCVAKEPEKRYQSAGEVADDLRAFLEERPPAARRPTWAERAARWSRRNPLAAGLASALVTALVGGLVGLTSLWAMAEDRREEAEVQAATAERERNTAEERLWKSLFEQARAERLAGRRWRSLALIAEASRQKVTPDLRQEAIQSIASPGVRLVATLGPQDVIYGGETPRVAFSSDGTFVAAPTRSVPAESGAEVSGVNVWEVASGRLVGQVPCIDQPASFAFSPADVLMAVAIEGQTVRLWDPTDGHVLSSFPGRHPLRFSPGGALLAVRGEEGIEIRDVPGGHLVRQLPAGMPQEFISDKVLLVRNDSRIEAWNVETGKIVSSSPNELTAIWSIALGDVAGNGPLLALRDGARHGLGKGPISIWNAVTKRTIATLPRVDRLSYAAAVPVSAESELVAFPDSDQAYAIQLFDLRLGAFRRPLLPPGGCDEPLMFGRFDPSGTVLAAQEGGLNFGVRLWNVETGESLAYLHGHEQPVWSRDGRYLALAGPGRFQLAGGVTQSGNRAAVLVYEVAKPIATAAVTSRPSAMAFDADGAKLAVQGEVFQVVDHGERRSLRPIMSESEKDGTFIASGRGVWRFRDYPYSEPSDSIQIERVFPERDDVLLGGVDRAEPGSVQNLAVSPEGSLLLLEWQRRVPIENRPSAYRMVHQLELWDLPSRSRVRVWESRPRRTPSWGILRFSPDGQLALTTEAGYLSFRDPHSGEVMREARLETVVDERPNHTRLHNVTEAVFTPDGRVLVCAAGEGRIGVLDVATGQFQAVWQAHDGNVTALAVNPQADLVASGGEDGMLRLWELGTGRELAHWEPHQNGVIALQFSPDGRTLVTASSDGRVRLWDLSWLRRQLAALDLQWEHDRSGRGGVGHE